MTVVTASLAAENTFSDVLETRGSFGFSLSGTFVATVTVQRSRDNSTWRDVDSWTAPSEEVGFEPNPMYYRVGIKTGGYTSGTAVVELNDDQERIE
jgi:hypothetical protein